MTHKQRILKTGTIALALTLILSLILRFGLILIGFTTMAKMISAQP